MERRQALNEFDELVAQGENLLKSCKANRWIKFHKCYWRSFALDNNLTKVVNKKNAFWPSFFEGIIVKNIWKTLFSILNLEKTPFLQNSNLDGF